MTCFPELTYAVYADGELPVTEARAVEMHLAACPRCRQVVEALRAENRLLADTLHEPAAEAAPPRPFLRPRDLAWAAPAVLLAAGGLEAGFSILALENGWVPQSAGFKNTDTAIALAPVAERTSISGRYALSTSLGFGGCDVALSYQPSAIG